LPEAFFSDDGSYIKIVVNVLVPDVIAFNVVHGHAKDASNQLVLVEHNELS
jgi:hypothetical protein